MAPIAIKARPPMTPPTIAPVFDVWFAVADIPSALGDADAPDADVTVTVVTAGRLRQSLMPATPQRSS
jgi:hypothetical protein